MGRQRRSGGLFVRVGPFANERDFGAEMNLRGKGRIACVEGRADELHYLLVEGGRAVLVPCPEFEGLGNYELVERLYEKHGRKAKRMV